MKLADHVDHLRKLIRAAFDKQFARLGIGALTQIAIERLPLELHAWRKRFEEMLQSHTDETGSYAKAREKLLDELTFTLFNRIAALKVMEAANFFPPVITRQAEHGDRSFGHKAWLEIRHDMRSEELEGIREFILQAFNELGESLPLYSRSYPYALLPDAINLNEIIEAFNQVEKDTQVEADIWHSDDVLGWLYESYNNPQKAAFKDSGEKTEYDKVSLQSQVYTPRWVVKFLVDNSLGKLYLEMYPDSKIRQRFKIANAPKTRQHEPKPLHLIKLIDPACGSGNFLLYAFELLYALYLDQIENYGADYDEKDIPRLIIENNLHGIDLDDRAVQLAQIGLYIKARKKQRDIRNLQFNVVSSDFYLPEYETVRHIFEEGTALDRNQKILIAEIWGDLQFAYKFGSLIQLGEKIHARLRELIAKREEAQKQIFPEKELGVKSKPIQRELFLEYDIEQERRFATNFFQSLRNTVEKYAHTRGNTFLISKTQDAIAFLETLTTEYDVVTANPPYTDDRNFGIQLKDFLDTNYQKPLKFNTNLYAAFLKRCYELTEESGKIAMIHPLTFMFIKSFEDVRKFILTQTNINVFVHYGPDSKNLFDGAFASAPAFYVLEKPLGNEHNAWFVSLDQYTRTPNEKYKKKFFLQALDDFILGDQNEHNYVIQQYKLKTIKSWPFIYWISDKFRKKFELPPLSNFYDICNGISSGGNNERFYRYWWEVNKNDILDDSNCETYKWVTINKGGDHKKWYGNLWLVFKWADNGKELKSLKTNYPSIRYSYENYYFQEGLAFSGSTSKGLAVRYQPPNCIFERAGKSIFSIKTEGKNYYYLLSLLNSKLVYYIADCLNPTVSIQSGDIERIPYIEPAAETCSILKFLSEQNVLITKHLLSFRLFEPNFFDSPLNMAKTGWVIDSIRFFNNYENYMQTMIFLNEAVINEKIYGVYELTEQDKKMILAKEGDSIGRLPVNIKARDAYLAENDGTFRLDHIHDFIMSLPVIEFTCDEREAIEGKFSSLYQNNNDLEEFCNHHNINPINVWYWFKQSNIIPQQRMHTLAMEFVADMIREILMEDQDGIISLVPNTGEKILLERIEDKFRQRGFTTAHYSQFDTVLGRPLDEYLNKYFFAELADHLNLFMYLPKTPFIWHLSSGPEQGFDCYIIIYKWSRDKLLRLKSVYVERRERSLINRQSDLAGNNSAEAQNEKDKVFKQLKEIEAFKGKIDELLAEGYNPILDDGVGKNIAPLQKKGIIPYKVLDPEQLEKYLNADW